MIQDFNAGQANFGVVGDHPELVNINYPPLASQSADWNHMNGISYDAANDWILFSANRQDEIWVIDHSTTTAEAAGHSADGRKLSLGSAPRVEIEPGTSVVRLRATTGGAPGE